MNKDIYPEGYEELNLTDPLAELTKLSQRVTDTAIQITKNRQKKHQGEISNQMGLIPFDRGILADILSEGSIYERVTSIDNSLLYGNLCTKTKNKAYLFGNYPQQLQVVTKFYPLVESLYSLNQNLIESRQGIGAINAKEKVWLMGGSFSLNPLSVIDTFDFLQERSDRIGTSLTHSTYNGGGATYRQTGFLFSGYSDPEYRDKYGDKIEKLNLLNNSIAVLGTVLSKGRKQKPILPQTQNSAWMFGEKEEAIERFDFLSETTVVENSSFAQRGFGVLSAQDKFYLMGGFTDKYKQGLTTISSYSVISNSISSLSLELSLPTNETMTVSFEDKGYLMGGWSNGRASQSIVRFNNLSESFYPVGVELTHPSVGGVGTKNV